MSLTGPLFLTLVIGVTVVCLVALVALWPRLAGRGVRQVAARLGLLLGVNALVLLSAAVLLNAQFLFFADWNDLRGAFSGSASTTTVARGGNAGQAARTKVSGEAATAGPSTPALPPGAIGPDGVVTRSVSGPLSGITDTVIVRLPPGYTDPANAGVRYPVIETFQGYPGRPEQWIGPMRLGQVLDDAVTARRIGPAIIVSPQTEIPAGVDTECVNGSPGRPQLETWLTRDVPDWVARTFRVQTERSSWATIGFSAGGWCAAMAAMLHPAQYSAAIVMGGYFSPSFGSAYEPYPVSSPLENRYRLIPLVQRKPPPLALWVETSHADPLSYGSSAALLRAVKKPMAVNAVVLQHAGHRLSVWQSLLPSALTWLGQSSPGFAAR